MRKLVRSSIAVLLLGLVALPLAAQDIQPAASGGTRDGFWWGIGLGAATASIDCNVCSDVDNQTFPMLDLRLGMTLSPSMTLGLQLSGGQKSDGFLELDDVNENVGDVNVSLYFYPQAAGKFWLQGGLAAVVFKASDDDASQQSVAPGLTLGAGYDFKLGSNSSITPTIRAVFGGKGDLTDQDGNSADVEWQTSFIEFGASVVWH